MEKNAQLQYAVYLFLKTQIEFGVHRHGDALPAIKDSSKYFGAGVDTVRLAYGRLKQEGYISLSPCIGSVVKVSFTHEQIALNIQRFFSQRRRALMDCAHASRLLFSYAQWIAFQSCPPQVLDELEILDRKGQIEAPYRMCQQLQLLYGGLGNELFLRLIWQNFLFFQGPFLNIPENARRVAGDGSPLLDMIALARKGDWPALWRAIEAHHRRFAGAVRRFYDHCLPSAGEAEEQIDFSWQIYKKTSQLCYSLAMALLRDVRQGIYPPGSLLPPAAVLAGQCQVSLNTVRRALALLNKMGAVQSINGVGTRVQAVSQDPASGIFSDATIGKRLLDFAQCLQILSLSCRAVAQATLSSMDRGAVRHLIAQLDANEEKGCYMLLLNTCFEWIARHAPYQLIRSVYTQLVEQHVWGYPLRNLHGAPKEIDAFYLPYHQRLRASLAGADAAGFALTLEEVQRTETALTLDLLGKLGIPGVESILVPKAQAPLSPDCP